MKDIKYLTAYVVPVCAIFGLQQQGFWVWLTPIYAFVMVPILEGLFPVNNFNIPEEEKAIKKYLHWTDFLLYFNIPIVFGIVIATV